MKNKRYIFAFILTAVFIVLFITGLYECPFKYFLGLSCPFCGVTRAIECLLILYIIYIDLQVDLILYILISMNLLFISYINSLLNKH